MKIADALDPRANAFGAIRLGAALLVVWSHACSVGGFGPDPLQRLAGVTLGELGVNTFFALSGFLVALSWNRRPSPGHFLRKRVLRIFPAYWACLLATALGLFPWLVHRLHDTSWAQTAFSADSLGYLWRNALLRIHQNAYPPLFADHPAAGVANGSLWSLFPEFLCYLGVLLLALLGAFHARRLWLAPAVALLLWLAQAAAPAVMLALMPDGQFGSWWWLWRLATQAAFFAAGVATRVHLGRLQKIKPAPLVAATALLLLAPPLGLYSWVAPLLLPPLVILLALRLPARGWERFGDYSYGLYLYHFPVQQTLVALGFCAGGFLGFLGASLALALPAAAASWWLVESPSLRWKPGPASPR